MKTKEQDKNKDPFRKRMVIFTFLIILFTVCCFLFYSPIKIKIKKMKNGHADAETNEDTDARKGRGAKCRRK